MEQENILDLDQVRRKEELVRKKQEELEQELELRLDRGTKEVKENTTELLGMHRKTINESRRMDRLISCLKKGIEVIMKQKELEKHDRKEKRIILEEDKERIQMGGGPEIKKPPVTSQTVLYCLISPIPP